MWRYGPQPLEPKTPSINLELGKWGHAGLKAWYTQRHLPYGERVEAMMAAYEAAYQAIAPRIPLDDEKWMKAPEQGRQLLAGYVARYPTETWEIIHVPDESVVLDLGDGNQLEFILDLMVRLPNRGLYVVDHKFLSSTGPSYYKSLFVDLQITCYLWAAERWLGEPISGFIPNVIKKTKTPQYERHQTYSRTPSDLEEFERQLIVEMRELKDLERTYDELQKAEPGKLYNKYVMATHWPKNTKACTARGTCEFIELCETQGDLGIVRAQFQPRERR
jgi:hypothetical protein